MGKETEEAAEVEVAVAAEMAQRTVLSQTAQMRTALPEVAVAAELEPCLTFGGSFTRFIWEDYPCSRFSICSSSAAGW